MSKNDIERITGFDRELVAIVKDFLILTPLSWPLAAQQEFLKKAEKGNYVLPKFSYAKTDYSEKIDSLKSYIKKLGKDDHPAIDFLKRNAESYLSAYYILQGVGTDAVTKNSKILYGSPNDVFKGYKRKIISIAKYFLRVVEDYKPGNSKENFIYSAEDFCELLAAATNEIIDTNKDAIKIEVDENIFARAAAGPNYVKIRKNARFSEYDLRQLLHHEVFTHTLTYINGRNQPVLSCLGYTAPRITGVQEGLATFAEYINFSIDIERLSRLALRIIALSKAEDGADLVDLYKFFKSHGQSNEESYLSAMRIFRGGTPKGGIIFYKDNVYLRGLIEVESFLKSAMHDGDLRNMDLLFAGKLTTNDTLRLQPLLTEGYIEAPKYIPNWMQKKELLAAHLALNDLTERFFIKPNK
ncbi:MAG: flavohemoglobin expression-modulating QEGLA motif protein [Alphaproteobacteria bacterium CG11_big_fil_rev_8_21_14_0_20_44_7]|nr:MAG: flavohemoglobin expression-modulating QEGLA motif protein [Alphaproteobacteria bacterium CG11_big_fil_rev_8_21_14_0_20_44_7]